MSKFVLFHSDNIGAQYQCANITRAYPPPPAQHAHRRAALKPPDLIPPDLVLSQCSLQSAVCLSARQQDIGGANIISAKIDAHIPSNKTTTMGHECIVPLLRASLCGLHYRLHLRVGSDADCRSIELLSAAPFPFPLLIRHPESTGSAVVFSWKHLSPCASSRTQLVFVARGALCSPCSMRSHLGQLIII